ncbi:MULTISPECIES: hypothetical protein [Cyanophyceae]|nr:MULTISPECIES: hypothetical protein [Cyanophyceae]
MNPNTLKPSFQLLLIVMEWGLPIAGDDGEKVGVWVCGRGDRA